MATRWSIATGDPVPVRSIWSRVRARWWFSARSRREHRIGSVRPRLRSAARSSDASGCWRQSGWLSTIGTDLFASMSPPSLACTSRCSRRRSSSRGSGGVPSKPCASAGASPARLSVQLHSGRARGGSCGGSQGTRRPWSPRTAAPVAPRRLRSLRPTIPLLSQQCPREEADHYRHSGGDHHVVGRLGDELAIRVEAHGTSIVPFPWKPSRSVERRVSSPSH